MAEPTPPKSPQGDDGHHQSVDSSPGSPTTPVEQALVQASPQSALPQPQCLHIKGCTTGSQLRKAISHLFGRNKLCTKAIPAHIWVHLCRKHYQRSRYRTADYAKKQADLVMKQINKVQAWSDENVGGNRRGDGVLQHWNLQARKREALRLQEQAASSRKRHFAEDDGQFAEDEGQAEGGDQDQAVSNGTAIPKWLQDKLNQQYNTADILEVIQQIEDYAMTNELRQFPDIEILPEIISDRNESRPRATTRRAGSDGGGHRHSKSDMYGTINSSPGSKRSRTGASPYAIPFQDMVRRPAADMNQAYPYQLNNGFGSIAHNQPNTNMWGPDSYAGNTVLPTPVPQRQVVSPLTPNISNGGQQSYATPGSNSSQQSYAAQGRSLHARSMSENPIPHGSGYGYRSYASTSQGYQHQDMLSSYAFPNNSYGLRTTYQGYGAHANTQPNGSHAHMFGPLAGGPPDLDPPRHSHARLHSTPSTSMQQSISVAGGPPSMNSLPSMSNMGHGTPINYLADQNLGLSSVTKGAGYGGYPQQHANSVQQQANSIRQQVNSVQQHMDLPSVAQDGGYVDYTQQSGFRY